MSEYEHRRVDYFDHLTDCPRCTTHLEHVLCSCPLGKQPLHFAEYDTVMLCLRANWLLDNMAQVF